MGIGYPGRLYDRFLPAHTSRCRLREINAKSKIGEYRIIEEHGFLAYYTHQRPQITRSETAYIHIVYHHRTRYRIIEPRQEVGKRGFPTA